MILKTLLNWFGSSTIGAIGGELNKAYSAKLTAQTSEQKLEADMVIEQLKAQQSILLAEQGKWHTSWIRPAFAFPCVVYMGKVILWDKALGLGSTPDLSPDQWKFFMIVVGAYFLTRPLEKVFRK